MSIEEVGNGVLPNLYVSEIRVEETPVQYIIKSLLSLREFEDVSGNTQWTNTVIHDHARIRLVYIITTNDKNDILNDSRKRLIYELNTGNKMPLDVYPSFNVHVEDVPLKSSTVRSNSYHLNDDGEKVYDVVYETNQVLCRKIYPSVKDVYMYACTYMDLNEVVPQLIGGAGFDTSAIPRYTGPTVSEQIVNNGELVTICEYFITETTGRLYTGPVHFHEERGYMAGEFHSNETHESLVPVRHPNLKLTQTPNEIPTILKEDFNSKIRYSSNIFYSVDNRESIVGMFFLDMKNIALKEVEIARKLYNANHHQFSEILEKLQIKSFEIFRNNIKHPQWWNSLGVLIDSDSYRYDENDTLIVKSFASESGKLENVNKYVFDGGTQFYVDPNTLAETYEGEERILSLNTLTKQDLEEASHEASFEEIDIDEAGVRLFSFSDKRVRFSQGNKCNYGIRITLTNNFDKYIMEKARGLKRAIDRVHEYYNIVTIGNNFNIDTNQFHEKFIIDINKSYGFAPKALFSTENISETMKLAPWIHPVVLFREAAKIIKNTSINADEIIKNLSPLTATPSSILKVKQEMSKMYKLILDYYNISESEINQEYNGINRSIRGSTQRKSTHTIQHIFRNIFDLEKLNNYGFKYSHSARYSSAVRVPIFSKQQYTNRIHDEILKHWTVDPSDRTENLNVNTYGYLSPISMKKKNGDYSLNKGFDISLRAPKSVNKTKQIDISISPFDRGIISINQTGTESTPPSDDSTSKMTLPEKYVGKDSYFVNYETEEAENQPHESYETDSSQYENIFAAIEEDKGEGSKLNNFNKISTKIIASGQPLQILAAGMPNDPKTIVDFQGFDVFRDPVSRGAAKLFYTKIKKVEVFTGFDKFEDLNVLNSVKWVTLTKEIFDSLTGVNLCRLVPYDNEFYNFVQKDTIKDYDSLFIINGD